MLDRHGTLEAPALGPLMDEARRASATSARADRRLAMALRVSGGELRGRRLAGPRRGESAADTERVREALFSVLGDVSGAQVLDLFCGTGALGIEALSRGAGTARFVDRERGAAPGATSRTSSLRGPRRGGRHGCVPTCWRPGRRRFDLVLCDPPYGVAADLDRARPRCRRRPRGRRPRDDRDST